MQVSSVRCDRPITRVASSFSTFSVVLHAPSSVRSGTIILATRSQLVYYTVLSLSVTFSSNNVVAPVSSTGNSVDYDVILASFMREVPDEGQVFLSKGWLHELFDDTQVPSKL